MVQIMLPTSPTTLPKTGILSVPCYDPQQSNTIPISLIPNGRSITFDFSKVASEDYELATVHRGHDQKLQGLIAIDSSWLFSAMQAVSTGPVLISLKVVVNNTAYFISPLNSPYSPKHGAYIVATLS